jgi:hypothetical protein
VPIWAGSSGAVEGFDDRFHGFDARFGLVGQIAPDLVDAESTEAEERLRDLVG